MFRVGAGSPEIRISVCCNSACFLADGVLRRWKWACEWQYHGKMWLFDDCKPETKRRIYIVILSMALIASLTMFFV